MIKAIENITQGKVITEGNAIHLEINLLEKLK